MIDWEKDAEKRAAILKDAEKLLLKDAPIAPIYFVQSAAMVSENLKKIETNYFGVVDFTKAKDSTYKFDPASVEALIPVKTWF